MAVKNPRFPHYCRILRYAATDPMVDQPKVNPMVDEDPMVDETDVMTDETETENAEPEEGDTTQTNLPEGIAVLYEGKCRSDNKAVTSDNGEFNVSYRTLALPLKQDEWTEETIPAEGDRIELQRFGYTEQGIVVDKRPSNLGTHILWKYARN